MFANRLQQLNPYVPGEQPKDREYCKLNANENPFPPSPKVQKALSLFLLEQLRLYPDPESVELKTAIAAMLTSNGVLSNDRVKKADFTITPEMIFCGNGSDEVLSFIFYAFFDSSKPLTVPEHTYSFYPVYAGFYGIRLQRIPLAFDFSLDTAALEKAVRNDSCGIIFANPNAPTGIALSLKQLDSFLNRIPADCVAVVDEAYVDFGGETALPLLQKYPNLLIVRTFSKSMSFAGMRLGFAVGAPELINALTVVKNSFNHFPVDALCQTAGIAACSDVAYYRENCRTIMHTREHFSTQLRSLGWKVLPSVTNFVFVAKIGLSGRHIYEKIKEAGILVRHFDQNGITDFVRITIGTEAQMHRLYAVMKAL